MLFKLQKFDGNLKIGDIIFCDKLTEEPLDLNADNWDIKRNYSAINKKLTQADNEMNDTQQRLENFHKYAITPSEEPLQECFREESLTRTVYSFNRTAMATYAKTVAPRPTSSDNKVYYSNGTTARGSSEAPSYYDFATLASDAYDCTNFISHVLLSGGAKMNTNGDTETGWYFINTNPTGSNSRSSTWSNVTKFGNLLINNSGDGPRGQLVWYLSNATNVGDIIQFQYSDYNPTGYGHSTVITTAPFADNLGNYISGQSGPIVNAKITGRSSSGSYKVDQNFYRKVLNLDGGNNVVDYRIIQLTGYAY